MKYRKRPVVIDAVQFTGDNWDEMVEFTADGFRPAGPAFTAVDSDAIAEVFDRLHDTWVGVMRGQWVIRGVLGETYPCADDVFASTYEPVSDADAPAASQS